MKSYKIQRFVAHALVIVFASSFLMSCGAKRERPVVSLKALKFANGATVDQAALNQSTQNALTNLLGSYQGTWSVASGTGSYQIDLTTEDVQIEETQAEYTLAKLTLTSANIQLTSYLAVQAGTVSGSTAFAFSSTVQSNPLVTPNAFGIYLVLAHNGGNFISQNSGAYLLDCGGTYMNTGACQSSASIAGARFTSGLNKL